MESDGTKTEARSDGGDGSPRRACVDWLLAAGMALAGAGAALCLLVRHV